MFNREERGRADEGLVSELLPFSFPEDGVLGEGWMILRPPHLWHLRSSEYGNGVVSDETLVRRPARLGW